MSAVWLRPLQVNECIGIHRYSQYLHWNIFWATLLWLQWPWMLVSAAVSAKCRGFWITLVLQQKENQSQEMFRNCFGCLVILVISIGCVGFYAGFVKTWHAWTILSNACRHQVPFSLSRYILYADHSASHCIWGHHTSGYSTGKNFSH